MKLHLIKKAQEEAYRMANLANDVINEAMYKGNVLGEVYGKNPASLKRASLDLSRALSAMRK